MEASPDLLSLAKERFAVRDYHGAALLLGSLTRQGTLFADAYNLLGLALAMIGRTEDGLTALDEALRLNPRYIEAHLNRSVVLNQLGREREAQAAMAKAAELGATDDTGFPAVIANRLANAHASLGDDYRAAGALDRAIAEYRRALDLRPLFYDIRLALSRALLEHGRPAEAAEVLDEVLRRRPGWLDAMLLRGLAAYLAGDLETAGSVWNDASGKHPEEPRLEIYRSMLARRRREASGA
ncbi:MAG TPA: tetratricopeptide repeat protein [Gemmatimonadaceae bacterium]|nr:tetratricopeptide repeat protein [Gemmatimonadaceae bacterium]